MTGFQSKRKMAQDKLDDDDDTQVYSDTLLIAYQSGFADGKRAAQRNPLTIVEVEQILAQHDYELHGDRARYIVRMTEAAHNIKEGT